MKFSQFTDHLYKQAWFDSTGGGGFWSTGIYGIYALDL